MLKIPGFLRKGKWNPLNRRLGEEHRKGKEKIMTRSHARPEDFYHFQDEKGARIGFERRTLGDRRGKRKK